MPAARAPTPRDRTTPSDLTTALPGGLPPEDVVDRPSLEDLDQCQSDGKPADVSEPRDPAAEASPTEGSVDDLHHDPESQDHDGGHGHHAGEETKRDQHQHARPGKQQEVGA